MTVAGIRELKDNLSHYIRRVEARERVAVTAHGRIVAELVPPSASARGRPLVTSALTFAETRRGSCALVTWRA